MIRHAGLTDLFQTIGWLIDRAGARPAAVLLHLGAVLVWTCLAAGLAAEVAERWRQRPPLW